MTKSGIVYIERRDDGKYYCIHCRDEETHVMDTRKCMFQHLEDKHSFTREDEEES